MYPTPLTLAILCIIHHSASMSYCTGCVSGSKMYPKTEIEFFMVNLREFNTKTQSYKNKLP